jgi:hypothetical protein
VTLCDDGVTLRASDVTVVRRGVTLLPRRMTHCPAA